MTIIIITMSIQYRSASTARTQHSWTLRLSLQTSPRVISYPGNQYSRESGGARGTGKLEAMEKEKLAEEVMVVEVAEMILQSITRRTDEDDKNGSYSIDDYGFHTSEALRHPLPLV